MKSRLFEPTKASEKKREAILSERQAKNEKKMKERLKMMETQHRYTSNHAENGPIEYDYDTRESSPTIEIKDQQMSGYQEKFAPRNSSRRKRKERHDKINYEKSPVGTNSNRYIPKTIPISSNYEVNNSFSWVF